MIRIYGWLVGSLFLLGFQQDGTELKSAKPISTSRPEMKRLLEELKERSPRIPMPPRKEGERTVNNGHMRAYYLPESWQTSSPRNRPTDSNPKSTDPNTKSKGPGGTNSDPQMTLDPTFKTRLFWIVSRANNCYYCLGHQELKLARAGMNDNAIASLDCEWTAFPAAEQAAFEFTRKITIEPHLIDDNDLAQLKAHFTDPQIIELVQAVAQFNATNRWTDSLGIPQDREFSDEAAHIDKPTDAAFVNRGTCVAPLKEPLRPALESRSQAEQMLERATRRTPRVTLAEHSTYASLMPQSGGPAVPKNWLAALAFFPTLAKRQVDAWQGVQRDGKLSPRLKAEIAWVTARENRAWYALGHARARLTSLGVAPDQQWGLDQNQWESPAAGAALSFARKLVSHSRTIGDSDIAELRRHFSDHEVAEIVYLTAYSNMFDQLTESLGLPLTDL